MANSKTRLYDDHGRRSCLRARRASSPRIKEALQDEHRGHLVDHRAPASRQAARRIQMTMRLGGREPFVPKRNPGAGLKLKSLRQGLGLERLRAYVP